MEKKKTYNISLKIINNSPDFIGELCYVTGNFNNWIVDGFEAGYIPEVGGYMVVHLDVEAGVLEFKLSRGSWATLNSDSNGRLMAPYRIEVNEDTQMSINIDTWRDLFPTSTASAQVHVLDEKFWMPHLGVHRRVWIYLPEGYADTVTRYPVLYMHDGQHLFDEATSRGRIGPVEWCVDEVIDAAVDKAIVVAVEHADEYRVREQEYRIHAAEHVTDPKGWNYLQDIVEVLKPYVDRHYRTLPAREYTAVLGSSLGGLLNIFAGLRYSDVFGTVGVFSPSIWLDSEGVYYELQIFNDTQAERSFQTTQHYYFYCGENENRRMKDGGVVPMVDDMRNFVSELQRFPSVEVYMHIHKEGRHGALYWQKEFPFFYAWWHNKLKFNT